MKKLLPSLRIILCSFLAFFAMVPAEAQTTIQIGTGTDFPSSTLYFPVYRFSATSTTTGCRSNILFTQDELVNMGMITGSTITSLQFNKVNAENFIVPANYKLFLANTSNTSLATTLTWASIQSTHTEVYSNSSFNLPNTAGWVTWDVTPFVYTGGSLEIACDMAMSGGSNTATGPFQWQYTAGTPTDRIVGVSSPTGTVLNGTVATYKNRPNAKITFTLPNVCTSPPTPGVAASSATNVCNGELFNLILSGNSIGSGQTYQWQSSPDSSTWTNIPGGNVFSFNTSQSATTFYRCAVTCSGNTTFSEGVKVSSPALVSGTFSINSIQPTGGTNFQTFNDAIAYIKCGINGPVVFNVEPFSGPYNEQVQVPEIFGTSSTNTITINGNGSTLSFTANVSTERTILSLNGTDHMIIDSLNIDGSAGLYGWGIFMTNGADSNIIRRCTLTTNASSTSTNYMNIVMNGSNSATNSASNSGNYNTIMNNTLIGGYYGVYLYGQSTILCEGNKVIGNKIIDPYSYFNYVYGQNGTLISQNDMTRPNRTSAGTLSGAFISTSTGATVEKNRIHNIFGGVSYPSSTLYGIYVTSADGTTANPHNFTNNLIYDVVSNGTIYGIYNSGSDSVNIYHNTIVLDDAGATSGTTYGFYQVTEASGIDFRNNIIYISRGGTGTKRAVYFSTTTSEIISNNNVLYLNSAGGSNNNLGQYGTLNYADLDAWKTANGGIYDFSSFSVDPLFVNFNPGDYKPSEPAINNIGASGLSVTTDINGTTRTPLPDPGAVEFTLDGCTNPPTAGLAITSTTVACAGEIFTLNLDGNSVGAGQRYKWQVSPDDATWTDADTAYSTPVFSVSLTESSYYRCLVTCNGGTAAVSSSVYVFKPTVTGTYTINNLVPTAGANFASFTEAFAYLKCGITGPVVFNVEPFTGPYNEQAIIPEVPGTSTVNTITVNGNGATLTWNPTGTGDRTAFLLNGADHIILDSLIIDVSAGTTYGWGIQLTNQADSNVIRKCTIISNTSSTSTNYAGIVISGSVTSATTAGNNGNGNLIEENTITGGYYGIQVYGGSGTTTPWNENNIIRNNTILDYYYYSIYFYGQINATMSGNDMSRQTRTNGSSYGCYMSTSGGGILMEKNKVHDLYVNVAGNTGYVYYLSGDGTSGNPNRFENNLAYNISNGSSTQYGIYGTSADYWNIYHNTIILDDASATAGSTYASYVYGANELNFANNIFVVTRGGTGVKVALYGSSTGFTSSNNNVLYVNAPAATTSAVAYLSSYYTTLADWQASNSMAYDQLSYSIDPLFQVFNPGEYIPSEPSINNIGANVGVLTDILGMSRTANPDPGAFEFSIGGCTNPPSTGFVTAMTTVCPNTDFTLDLTGNSVGENLTFQWQVSPDSTNWTNIGTAGTAPLITTSQTFGNFYRCVLKCGAGAPVASAGFYVSSPALVSGGTYTINSTVPTGGGNFQSFGDAVSFMSCGISGAIVFNVEPFTGPYNERVIIPQIGGASATNTITFNGNGNSLTWNPTGTDDRTAFLLNGADHIILDSLTIDVSAGTTHGWGIHLTNQADSNVIRRCTILSSTSSTSSNYAGIVVSGSLSSGTSSGNNGNGNLIENNTITGGYYGVQVYGGTSPYNMGNTVRGNTIIDFYYYSVYFYGQENSTMSGNDASRPTRTNGSSYAFYVSTNNGGILVEKNKLHNLNDAVASPGILYGYYLGGSGVAGNINRFENNIAYNIANAGSNQYMLYGLSRNYWDISHNTLISDDASATGGTTYAMYIYGTTELRIFNNIISVSRGGTGTKYCLYTSTTGMTASNNNVFHMASTQGTNGVVYYTSGYTTLASWKASNGGAYDQNSLDLNPLFADVSSGNLLPYEPLLDNAGNGLAGVTTDIRGEVRNLAAPTPGVFEITTILPVTLIHLSGTRQSNDVRLDWTTVNEFNNAGFDIERSTDGIRFSKVGYVTTKAPNGNNTGKLSYDYLDVHVPKSDVFYRLKQIDKDGTSELSNVVVMGKIGVDKLDITNVYPNPASRSGALKLQMTSPETSRVTLVITDVTGKVLRQQTEILQSGTNTMDVNVKSLSAGTYFIKAICTDGCETTIKKFIVQ